MVEQELTVYVMAAVIFQLATDDQVAHAHNLAQTGPVAVTLDRATFRLGGHHGHSLHLLLPDK